MVVVVVVVGGIVVMVEVEAAVEVEDIATACV